MSLEDLNAELLRRQAKEDNQRGKPVDRPLSNEMKAMGIMSLADVMPAQLEVLRRMEAKWKAFCKSIKPEYDRASPTIACPTHPKRKLKKLWDDTCMATRQEGKFTPIYAPCSECADSASKARRREFWIKRGVPERVVGATFLSFDCNKEEKDVALFKVSKWMLSNGVFLMLTGNPGTGKGHLAASCLKQKGDGLFITHADMLSDLRASYSTQTTAQLIEKWQECEMFVLDEFGLSAGGNDEQPMLYQVLAERHDKRRPTIITTNQPREKVRELLGYRLLDRIREDVEEVPMNWESFRTKKPK